MLATDEPYLSFDRVVPVSATAKPGKSPTDTAASAVWHCANGEPKRAVRSTSVDPNAELEAVLDTFIKEFCPDLAQYQGQSLYLRHDGYLLQEDVSVWYYHLVTRHGEPLAGNPWVSLHRSNSTGECKLTGIFLPEAGKPAPDLPSGLVTAESGWGRR